MAPQDITQVKEFIAIAVGAVGLFSAISTIIGVWFVSQFRLKRLENVVFGNGNKGVLEELEQIRITCAANHGKVPA